jgi:HAD superfamily hydrolase (TIGR01490 family)
MQTSSERHEIHNVAVFDFDGTIVDGQSGALFTTYLFRNHIMSLGRALRLGWWGVRYKLHLPYRQDEARELVFGALLGRPYDEVDALMVRFHDEVLLPRYRPQAVDEVARRSAEGNVTLLVSATFETIAQAAARTLGMDGVVATQMAHDAQGAYLGVVEGPVIAGAEKYRAVVRWCDERLGFGQWLLAYAYGDHHTDKDLLSHAQEPFAVCPGKTLHAIAKQHGWKILDWDA